MNLQLLKSQSMFKFLDLLVFNNTHLPILDNFFDLTFMFKLLFKIKMNNCTYIMEHQFFLTFAILYEIIFKIFNYVIK